MQTSPLAFNTAPRASAGSAAAYTMEDAATLRTRLTAIINGVQRPNPKEAQKALQDLCVFLDTVTEQSGTSVQDIFGQNVANNIIIIVLDRVVKPALTQYCETAAGGRWSTGTRGMGRGVTAASRRRLETSSAHSRTLVEEDSRTTANNKAKKLRTEVVRLWRALAETLHQNLPSSLLTCASSLSSSVLAATTNTTISSGGNIHTGGGNGDTHMGARGAHRTHSGEMDEGGVPTSLVGRPGGHSASAASVGGTGGFYAAQQLWAMAPNQTALPLLWKNAVPLFCVTQHALEVLQSKVLVGVCGQEYAQLLLHLLQFDGYLSNLKSEFIVGLTLRLLRLVEQTSYEPNTNNSDTTAATSMMQGDSGSGGINDVTPESDDSEGPCPSVEEGTTYAALLVQVFRASQLMNAFTPCEDTATLPSSLLLSAPARGSTSGVTLPFVMQRLVRVTTQRHMRPTSALRLEAHLLVAVNLLASVARDDYPLAAAAPLELVKRLCDCFHATMRRDGWRMEALTLMTTQICGSFSTVLGHCVRADIERNRPRASGHTRDNNNSSFVKQEAKAATTTTAMTAIGTTSVSPRFLTLLHETVLPLMMRLFTVLRSEFSLVSRRELFYFPCPPLAPLFDFGVVVLYLACCTHAEYVALPSVAAPASGSSSGGGGRASVALGSPVDRGGPRQSVREDKKRPRGGGGDDDDDKEMDNNSTHDASGERENAGRRARTPHIHPGDAALRLFRSLFFDSKHGTAAAAQSPTDDDERAVEDDADSLVQANTAATAAAAAAAAAGSGSLSAAAVQDLVKDGSLFLLHLFAQPGTTLGFTEGQCTSLILHSVLPLFPYYGVRLETLLLAVLHAVVPRASLACQQKVFRWLVRRYMPTAASQRDDDRYPKEQVYRLLGLLLERGVVGRWPLLVQSEERGRLQAAAHFGAITARIRVVLRGTPLLSSSATAPSASGLSTATTSRAQHTNSSTGGSNAGPSPVMVTSLLAAAATTTTTSSSAFAAAGGGGGGHSTKVGLSATLFQAMLQFLSSYHHYGATSAEIILSHRAADAKQQTPHRSGASPVAAATAEQALDLPSTAVRLSTGIAFVVAGLAHGVCFFPHDSGVVWRNETDTPAASAAAAALFLQTLRAAEDHVLAACLTVTESELGWQHSLASGGPGAVTSSPNSRGSSGRNAAALYRMRQLLARSRRTMEAAAIAPQRHVPAAVCEAAEGHWLLLHEFLSSSTEEVAAAAAAVDASPHPEDAADDGDSEGVELLSGHLRRGDVPPGVVEVLAAEVAWAVGALAERVKMAGNATEVGCHHNQKQQPQREVDEEAVALTHRTLCIHAVQLLHWLLRLFRLGIWQLPQSRRTRSGADGVEHHNANSKSNSNVNNSGHKTNDVDGDDEDDLHVLSSVPQLQLFDDPATVMRRLSPEGRLYYAVMWVCRHLATRLLRGALVRDRAVLRALLVLVDDVGVVLLSQSFALWEPRQVVLSFVGAVCRRVLDEGIVKLSAWRPTNVTSTDAATAVHATVWLCCRLLAALLALVRRTRVLAASADPLVSAAHVSAVVIGVLEKDGLIAPADHNTSSSTKDDGGHNLGALAEATALRGVVKLSPFLPFSLAVVDGVAGLLRVLHEAYDDVQARLAVRALLVTLFARYRHGIAAGIFATFRFYAPPCRVSALSLSSTKNDKRNKDAQHADDNEEEGMRGGGGSTSRGEELSDGCGGGMLVEEGKLLETFVDQLTDASRSDMPTLTPELQCAVLSSIYGLLFRCDASVAEKLGKYLFSFLSTKTAYVVRRYTALHVRWLFNRFTHRTSAVLHELLYRAREGIASPSPMLCATSLRALGEAAHAAPMMEADIICTLLECWATHGFAHKGLILECLDLIGDYTRVGDASASVEAAVTTVGGDVGVGGGNGMSAQQLCFYHRERLLFDWLWRLGHPMEAFPIACFGYSKQRNMWCALMPTLVPLALLCSARRGSEEDVSVFLQPSDLLWRLAACHANAADDSGNNTVQPTRTPSMLVDCVVAYFPDIMARLLAFATGSKRRGMRGGNRPPPELPDVANAAHVALEWLRTTLSSRHTPLVRRNADAILCRFVDLVGTLAPVVEVRQLRHAVAMLCEMAVASTTHADAVVEPMPAAAGVLAGHQSLLGEVSAVETFFASDAGDHAYVLLQRLYVSLTHDVHRGSRRALLVLLFECIVKDWWSRELLQRVPHMLHTVLRLCGNLLMTCVDARSRVCDVLLYAWSAATASGAERCVATDEAFLSTVMLALSEESRVVAATWAAISRIDAQLQQRDWQMQHTKYTADSVVYVDDGPEEDDEQQQQEEQEQRMDDTTSISDNEALRRVADILPLLRNTVLVSGAPASSFYTDVAAAVDRSRSAFVTLIRHCTNEEQQQRKPRPAARVAGRNSSASSQLAYEACCRAVQHLFALVCADDAADAASQATTTTTTTMITSMMITATTTNTTAAATVLQATSRDAQLGAFRLLCALCWCFIEAGAEGRVDALLSPTGAMQEMLQLWSLDEVLHRVYRQQVEELYRLSFDTDACIAHIASTTLRGWLCGDNSSNSGSKSVTERDDNNGKDDEAAPEQHAGSAAVAARECGAGPGGRRCASDGGELIQRALELIRDEEKKEEQQQQQQLDAGGVVASVRLADVEAFRRRLFDVPNSLSTICSDEVVSQVASLHDAVVWDALRVHEDETRFLRLFLVALIRHYSLHHRFSTVATLHACLLLRLPHGVGGSLIAFCEGFLPTALLHAMLLRESESQRSKRAAWSRELETCLFREARRFRRVTRLFLRALNVCRSVLMTAVRSRGLRPDASGTRPLARKQERELMASSASSMFPPFVCSAYGDIPEVCDMRESYWLSDVNPFVLAAAAVACHEPHLAVLFTELSGESLMGRRKGIPSSAALMAAAADGVMSTGDQRHRKQQFSVLFPSALRVPGSDGRGRKMRGEEAYAEITQILLAYRTAVHTIMVDVEAALQLRDGGDESNSALGTGSSQPPPTGSGDVVDAYTTPWEEAFFLRHPMRRIEREKNRGNWQAVLVLLDRLECAGGGGLSKTRLALEKSNALMQLGAVDTALQILTTAVKQKSHAPRFACGVDGNNRSSSEGNLQGYDEEEASAQLRAALAGALWRCGRWDAECMEDEEQQRRQPQELCFPSPLSVDEGIFFALRCLWRGDQHEARCWSTRAQQQLGRMLEATNWYRTVLQAEALRNVEECTERAMRVHFPPPPPPSWVHASLSRVHAPYGEVELLDSVQQQLCVAYRQPQWWLAHLEECSERALRGKRPLLVQQWLSACTRAFVEVGSSGSTSNKSNMTAGECGGSLWETTTPKGLPAAAFLALLHARVEFASGYPHRAIAILQDTVAAKKAPDARAAATAAAASLLSSSVTGTSSLLPPPMPAESAPLPIIVQQLVAWAKEARLAPLSQLVRDPFLTSCVSTDRSGGCALELARLCHMLARDIAARLRSAEYRTLRESIEASRRTRVELEQQRAASGLSEAEDKILMSRIRAIKVETVREEQEWLREVETYALYRRSALNAYARFLQYSGPAGADDLLAVFGFVSMWLQQGERIDDVQVAESASAAPATESVLRKAIDNTPLYKFLPLFSQLVAQLGTSLDDANLEDLVRRIARERPFHAVWPLLALAHGHQFGPAAAPVGGGGGVHVVDEKKVALARRILRALKTTTTTDPRSSSSSSSRCSEEDRQRQKIVDDAEKLSAAYMQLAFHRVHNTNRPVHRIPPGFMILEEELRNLSIPPPTLSLPAFTYTSPSFSSYSSMVQLLPRVACYEAEFTTHGGINLPKALRCVLSDGRSVRQLLKSEDDLRQDSLIEQVFALSNELLAKDPSTRRLRVSTYNVVPLAPTVGIIEWVDGTVPLGEYLNGSSNIDSGSGGGCHLGAHERYFPGEPTSRECRQRLHDANKSQKHDMLLALYSAFTPALHYFFLERFFTPQEWHERREAYTRSVAASSVVGYIVGLGDRHASNLLLQTQRAELVHIDLGFAFDQGKLLPVPELVPFRLTRNIVDGMGVQGTEGPFRRHCEGTLRVLRGQKELLMTILEACAHDPLARWAVTVVAPPQQQHQQQVQEEKTPQQRGMGVRRGKPTYADAERTLSRVAEKIQGYDSGELLSVPTHVHKLLQVAQSTDLLAYMFEGWSPWL